MHNTKAEPYTIRNAICIHEEDDAILWKHVDARAGAEVRRSRRLVLSFHVTVANYEYLVGASTRTATSSARCGPPGSWSRRISPRVSSRRTARSWMSARTRCSTSTSWSRGWTWTSTARPTRSTRPSPKRCRWGRTTRTGSRSSSARRRCAPKTRASRTTTGTRSARGRWSTTTYQRARTPVGYKLVPGAAIPPMMDPASPVLRRSEVIGHTLWVTPFDRDERWPSGEFVNQSSTDEGLPAWTAPEP